jgi:nanoRNase/pAp phosphatase (c-di-AMP/oligoRNAs hydrolase)
MLSPLQQAIDVLQKNNRLLIILPENLNGDALGCALALNEAFKNSGKKIDIVCTGEIPEKLKFLIDQEIIKNKLTPWRDFIISIDTSVNKISRLRYENNSGILKIFLTTPQKVEEKDVKLESGQFFYDLIIAIDAPDLESLGRVFEENTELFFNTPILNIDHKASNEYFGEVNFVEPTAASCSQIINSLFEGMKISPTEKISTALLCGLIIKTQSFQNSKTTPQALGLASFLINQGANQEKIIYHLYKSKPLNKLRLWGKLLSRLDFDEQRKIAWLLSQPDDFTQTKSTVGDLPFVAEEIFETFPQVDLVFILWLEENNTLAALIQAKQIETLQKMNIELGGTIKNDKLLIKTPHTDISALKDQINSLLSSNF